MHLIVANGVFWNIFLKMFSNKYLKSAVQILGVIFTTLIKLPTLLQSLNTNCINLLSVLLEYVQGRNKFSYNLHLFLAVIANHTKTLQILISLRGKLCRQWQYFVAFWQRWASLEVDAKLACYSNETPLQETSVPEEEGEKFGWYHYGGALIQNWLIHRYFYFKLTYTLVFGACSCNTQG